MTATRNSKPIPDTYDTLVEGQMVRLRSGSPDLTVLSVCDDCQEAEVAWFAGAKFRIAVLPLSTLVQSGGLHDSGAPS